VSLHKRVGPHPVEEVLAAIPDRKNHVWITFIDRPQNLVRNKTRHLVHQPCAFTKPLLESFGVFRLYVDAIGNSYHGSPLVLKLAHSSREGFERSRLICERRAFSSSVRFFAPREIRVATRFLGR
jgi:hypothetical protein